MEKHVNAVQARQQFGRLLEEVFYQNHDVVIERAGRPMAVLVTVERYQEWQERRHAFFASVDEVQQRTRMAPPDILQAELAEAVAAAKASDDSDEHR